MMSKIAKIGLPLTLLYSLYCRPIEASDLERAIDRQIAAYQKTGYVHKALERISNYESYIEKAADRTDLPECLIKGLIAVESGGYLDARSRSGAKGPAQFITSTAKASGIKISKNEDWRHDPVSILYSAELLDELIEKYGLVNGLQAYNCGEGCINWLNTDNWSKICEDVPRETCWYPVKVLAAEQICEEYDIKTTPLFDRRELVKVKHGDTVWSIAKQIAQKYNLSTEDAFTLIRLINPQLKNPNKLVSGQKIWIPNAPCTPQEIREWKELYKYRSSITIPKKSKPKKSKTYLVSKYIKKPYLKSNKNKYNRKKKR